MVHGGFVGAEIGAGAVPDDGTFLHDVVALGKTREILDILVDDENGETLRLEAGEAGPNFAAHQRRQPFGGFIEN